MFQNQPRGWLRRATTLIGVAVLGLALSAGPASASTKTEVDTDTVQKAVLWLDMAWPVSVDVPFQDSGTKTYNDEIVFYCTAFFVSPDGYIATAGHCVETSTDHEVAARNAVIATLKDEGYTVDKTGDQYNWAVSFGEPSFYVGQPNTANRHPIFNDGTIKARLVDYQSFQRGDNALLQLANISDAPVLPIATTKPQVRDEVIYVGFPGTVGGTTDENRQPPTFKDAKVASLSVTDGGVPIIQLDNQIAKGMSGGPAMNQSGEVVGINSSLFTGTTESFITDTDMMRDFLEKNNVLAATQATPSSTASPASGSDVVSAPAESDSDSGSNTMMILVVVLIVVVVGMGGFIVYYVRRNQPQAEPAAIPTYPPGDPRGKDGSDEND